MHILIGPQEANQRFDRFLRKYFKTSPEIRLNDIFAWIRKGAIKVNGKKFDQGKMLQDGDIVSRNIEEIDNKRINNVGATKEQKKNHIEKDDLQQYILYEDTNRIIRNKEPGIVIHPGNKHTDDITLNDMLEQYYQSPSKTFKPSFCFRLDKDTSGIIIAAKNFSALQYLNELIRKRSTKKSYLTIVYGKFPPKSVINKSLTRGFNRDFGKAQTFVDEGGNDATTIAENLLSRKDSQLGELSLLSVQIITGRMHQIRVHLASEGFPIVGDLMYGNPAINRLLKKNYHIVRQMLHSYTYNFFDDLQHKKITATAPIPDDFIKIIETTNEGKHITRRLSGRE